MLNKKAHALVMYLTVPLAAVTVDIVITSLPSIKNIFNTTTHLAQFVFTFGVLGFGIGQAFSGFIADAFDRKKVLSISILGLILLLTLSIIANNIYTLNLLRFLQGLVISFIAVTSRAVVRDIHTNEEYKNAVNYITIGFALALTCSPIIGSVILLYFSYKMVFLFLIIYALTMLILIFFTKETNTHKKTLNTKNINIDLKALFADKTFVKSLFMCGCFYTIIPIFDTLGSFLTTEVYGYTLVEFGWSEILLAVAWLTGNVINRIFSNYSLSKKTMWSFIIGIITVLSGFTYFLVKGESDIALLTSLVIIAIAVAVLFPLHLGAALVNHSKRAGVANAIIFSGCWLITSLVTNAATLLDSHTSFSIYILLVSVLSLALIIYTLGLKTRKTIATKL